MLTRAPLALLLAIAGPAIAASTVAGAADLTVAVTGLPQESGALIVCLWAQPSGFPDCSKGESTVKSTTAREGATVRFAGIPDGTYAVSVLHDVNGDGKLGTNLIGIPNEPVGFSNNVRLRFGPPKFDAAAIDVAGDETITVAVRKP
jgi:uncharacterized protein (DUF2141 family)